MDVEGFVRRRIWKENEAIIEELAERLKEFKNWRMEKRKEFSRAVLQEVKTANRYKNLDDPFLKTLMEFPKSKVKMGEFGVGCRGEGDFFVHREMAKILRGKTVVGPMDQDDAGVIEKKGKFLTLAIDGMHSRLSEFPFLAGFHACRASLRDVFVMGSVPVALITDLRLGDDGDIGKLFDFIAGVACVSELVSAPLIAGSTLRIGGDMVLGDRFVGTVGTVGASDELPKRRKNAEEGDVILMSEGKGGGTITAIAIYSGNFGIIKETLNVEFMHACKKLMEEGLLENIHAMSDVTNGGLRGDANQISITSRKKLVFYEESLYKHVNKKIAKMLNDLKIDPLGISTDSLLLILPEEYVEDVNKSLRGITNIYEVGFVDKGKGAKMLGEKERDFNPLFRESAYTQIKKIIGEEAPAGVCKMKKNIEKAREEAIEKKEMLRRWLS
jgi:hydrogenase expression/formation protein